MDAYVLDACSLISINHLIDDVLLKEAGRIKAVYRLSLADAIAIAEAKL